MEDKKKILVLTAQFGNGHTAVASALKQLIENHNAYDVEIRDFYKMIKPKLYKNIYKNYTYLVKYGSWLYNSYYYSKERFDLIKALDTFSLTTLIKLKKQIEDINPDIIISTFSICSGYISKYKQQYEKKTPLITIITDICAANEWVYPNTDLYCVATQEVKEDLKQKGVNENKILITGIPVKNSFYQDNKPIYDYDVLNKIPKQCKLLTFIGGGLGLLPQDIEFYQWLQKKHDVFIIIITGKNKKFYEQLSLYVNHSNVTILGYTNHMDEIMKRSNWLISKPGGITLFESIMCDVPCIITPKPTLGQEKGNIKFVTEKKIGMIALNELELREQLTKIINDDSIQKEYINNIKSIKKSINMNQLLNMIKIL